MTFDDEDALVARLLRAGRADGPSARALQAAPVAVGALLASTAAHAALAQAGVSAVAEVGRAAVSPLVLVKWIAVGTLAGSSLMAVVHAPELLRSRAAAKAEPAPPPPASARAAAAAAASAQLAAVPLEPEPAAEPASTGSVAGMPSAPRQDVAREVSVLDSARRALVQGNAAEALRLLATLERVPARALVPEATVLRVRALLTQGERDEARAVTERFCGSAAASPQCAVLRTLLANSVIQPLPSRL